MTLYSSVLAPNLASRKSQDVGPSASHSLKCIIFGLEKHLKWRFAFESEITIHTYIQASAAGAPPERWEVGNKEEEDQEVSASAKSTKHLQFQLTSKLKKSGTTPTNRQRRK
ncbi:hypothetical protein N7G274_003115 [Stereocaulon virgatum]|uniref:Uncharacterized protein n=1 Tax=Stereocaulon virgatum TaxID=373712 RepID=A0ABR4AG33_9LECA